MKIYLIKIREDYIDEVPHYDSYDSHVVVAKNEEEARLLCLSADEGDVWTNRDYTDCIEILPLKMKPQLILSSFNAG